MRLRILCSHMRRKCLLGILPEWVERLNWHWLLCYHETTYFMSALSQTVRPMQGILKQKWMKTAQTVCWRRCWRSQTDCWWSLCWCWKKKVEVSVKKGIVLYCFENYLLPGSLQNGSVKHKCDLLFFAFNNIYRLKTFLFPFLIKFEINNNSLSLAQ